jgi:hypothetical protein
LRLREPTLLAPFADLRAEADEERDRAHTAPFCRGTPVCRP